MSVSSFPPDLVEAARVSQAWPFEEARKLVVRLEKHPKDEVLFETGYGPSGLPHIGTFGEVARTTMIRRAFEVLSDIPTQQKPTGTEWDRLFGKEQYQER